VLDASRAVGVVSNLISPSQKPRFVQEVRNDYDRMRQIHQDKGEKPVLPIARARANRLATDWAALDIPTPGFLGVRVIADQSLTDLIPFIDWSPFFHTWELRGRYPAIFDDVTVGAKAKELYDDARRLLDEILRKKLLRAKGVYGFFAAAGVGDDIELYTDASRTAVLTTVHTLRQQAEKPDGQPNRALSDYIAPKDSGRKDFLGAFAVTSGIGMEELCKRFDADHDDYNSIMAKALADRLAEAFAEYLHRKVREEWGYGTSERLTADDLIREKYRGIRPAPGYPACPDHTEKRLLFDLLSAEQATGITLTESFAMLPAAAVSGFYFAHPDAKYFAVGKIGKDQVEDYAFRKGMDQRTIERWLSPNLNYEPDSTG
jgi:5-methyltetrahydrofolate--homocysteine methyltransferase